MFNLLYTIPVYFTPYIAKRRFSRQLIFSNYGDLLESMMKSHIVWEELNDEGIPVLYMERGKILKFIEEKKFVLGEPLVVIVSKTKSGILHKYYTAMCLLKDPTDLIKKVIGSDEEVQIFGIYSEYPVANDGYLC